MLRPLMTSENGTMKMDFVANWKPDANQLIVVSIILTNIYCGIYVHGAMAVEKGKQPSGLVGTLGSVVGFLIGLALFTLWRW